MYCGSYATRRGCPGPPRNSLSTGPLARATSLHSQHEHTQRRPDIGHETCIHRPPTTSPASTPVQHHPRSLTLQRPRTHTTFLDRRVGSDAEKNPLVVSRPILLSIQPTQPTTRAPLQPEAQCNAMPAPPAHHPSRLRICISVYVTPSSNRPSTFRAGKRWG
jgi:hypothetical protein